jgi:histone deacetylase 8
LSILQLRQLKPGCRIFYLDLDLHYSDAVSTAFTNSSTVLTLSIHHRAPGFYPHSPPLDDKNPYNICVPLAAGASDETFRRIWLQIEKIKEAFKPDFIVTQCGLDGLAGDPCKIWNWSLDNDIGSLAWCIRRIVEDWNVKTIFLGGGGYNTPNTARAWAYMTSIIVSDVLAVHTVFYSISSSDSKAFVDLFHDT